MRIKLDKLLQSIQTIQSDKRALIELEPGHGSAFFIDLLDKFLQNQSDAVEIIQSVTPYSLNIIPLLVDSLNTPVAEREAWLMDSLNELFPEVENTDDLDSQLDAAAPFMFLLVLISLKKLRSIYASQYTIPVIEDTSAVIFPTNSHFFKDGLTVNDVELIRSFLANLATSTHTNTLTLPFLNTLQLSEQKNAEVVAKQKALEAECHGLLNDLFTALNQLKVVAINAEDYEKLSVAYEEYSEVLELKIKENPQKTSTIITDAVLSILDKTLGDKSFFTLSNKEKTDEIQLKIAAITTNQMEHYKSLNLKVQVLWGILLAIQESNLRYAGLIKELGTATKKSIEQLELEAFVIQKTLSKALKSVSFDLEIESVDLQSLINITLQLNNLISTQANNCERDEPIQIDALNQEEIITEVVQNPISEPEITLSTESIQSLFDAIQKMHEYGEYLKQEEAAKGDVVLSLTSELRLIAESRIPNIKTKTDVTDFQRDFTEHLHSQNAVMKEHRYVWESIIANIAIALTGIGAFAVLAQLAYSKWTTGQALGFFQKVKTSSEEYVELVEEEVLKLGPP